MPYFPPAGGSVLLPGSIDNTLLAPMPAGTVKGRTSASAGPPQDIAMPLSYRNLLGRNGGLEVFQRGAGGTLSGFAVPASTTAYAMDGWCIGASSGNNISTAQRAGLVNGSQWCAYVQRNPGATSTAAIAFEFPLDTDEIALARGNVVTLSLLLKAGSTFGGNIVAFISVGDGTPRKLSAGFTNRIDLIVATVPITTTVTRFVYTSTLVVPGTTTQATLYLQWNPAGTAGIDDAFYIDDVQLEIGPVATPFERRPFESELAACKRHFWKSFAYSEAPAVGIDSTSQVYFNIARSGAAVQFGAILRHPVVMRAAPTIVLYGTNTAGQIRNRERAIDHTTTNVAIASQDAYGLSSTGAASGVAGDLGGITLTADAGI